MKTRRFDHRKCAALREQRHLTLADLGALAGVSESTICRYEQGNRQPKRLRTVDAIAAALDVKPDELWLPIAVSA